LHRGFDEIWVREILLYSVKVAQKDNGKQIVSNRFLRHAQLEEVFALPDQVLSHTGLCRNTPRRGGPLNTTMSKRTAFSEWPFSLAVTVWRASTWTVRGKKPRSLTAQHRGEVKSAPKSVDCTTQEGWTGEQEGRGSLSRAVLWGAYIGHFDSIIDEQISIGRRNTQETGQKEEGFLL